MRISHIQMAIFDAKYCIGSLEESINIIADELYTLYCDEVGGKSYSGEPLPEWSMFSSDPKSKKQADAWRAVANRVLQGAI